MKKIIVVFSCILLLFICGLIWWQHGLSAVNLDDKTKILFVVSKQENMRDIGYALKRAHIIQDPIVFFLKIKQSGFEGKVQAGDFRLSPSMSLGEILQTLTHGTLDIWVTIPEGKRSAEIAEILATKIPTYNTSWKGMLIAQEGYLFPDTYLFPNDADINQIMRTMKDNFIQKYSQAEIGATSKLSQQDAVILASIMQREGRSLTDMKIIASVFENRLSIGMALQTDATIQYALGYQPIKQTWWKNNLSVDDLKISSPYNTYLNTGLPPTPISNPGLDALTAVLHPAQTEYLYYISDNNGTLHYAKTLQQHNANVAKYL